MLKRMFVGAVLACAAVGQAHALSGEQRNGLSHVGQVAAATKICSSVEVEMGSMAILMAGLNLDLKDPVQSELVRSKARESIDAWDGQDEKAACLVVMMLYGPEGANVPGLLRWKK